MISCKEATQYISLKEEGKLSLRQRWHLWQHLAACTFCRLFFKQNKIFTTNTATLMKQTDVSLTKEQKDSLIKTLENL